MPFLNFECFAGFDTKGDDAAFFGSFDDAAAKKPDSSKVFDAAFDTGAWGENNPSAEPEATAASQDQGQEVELLPPASQDETDQQVGADRKAENPSDSKRGDRSHRRREGGGRPRSSRNKGTTGVEAGVESMNIGDGSNAAADGEKRDRPSRSRRAEDEKERKRSGSRSRRKRPPRVESGTSRPTGDDAAAASAAGGSASSSKGSGPRKGSSFRSMFNRKEKEKQEES